MPLLKDMTTAELAAMRAAEAEIDGAHATNPLMREDLGAALWALLSFVEDLQLRPIVQGNTDPSYREAALIDETLNALKFPIAWLHSRCARSKKLRKHYGDTSYQSAWDLLEMARRYSGFEGAFQNWIRGDLGLRIEGNRIIVEADFAKTSEYEAYNRLSDYEEGQPDPPEADGLGAEIDALVRIQGDRFSVTPNPRLIERVMALQAPMFSRRFTLPESWAFTRYSLREFRLIYLALFSLAVIQRRARIFAAAHGCRGLGFVDAVVVTAKADLVSRLTRYTGLPQGVVQAVLSDLTYGSRQRTPDPALQPFITLAEDSYAVVPFLWLHSSPERNLCALLNRIPTERAIYLRLTEEKEQLMRAEIEAAAKARGFRTASGNIPGRDDIGDVDLAIISDADQLCLLLELKWFVPPAEIREVHERRQELQKGISQVERRLAALREDDSACHSFLKSVPRIEGAVISKNWIGDSSVQQLSRPVIATPHFIAKLGAGEPLSVISDWLATREYLPVLDKHYSIGKAEAVIGRWAIEWYGIKALVDGPFIAQ